jgi:hypothetical protein
MPSPPDKSFRSDVRGSDRPSTSSAERGDTYILAEMTLPRAALPRTQGLQDSLQAFYFKEAHGKSARYVEDLEIQSRASSPDPAGSPTVAGWAR